MHFVENRLEEVYIVKIKITMMMMIIAMMMTIHLVETALEEVDIVEVVKLDRKLNCCLEFAHITPLHLGSPSS